MQNIPSSYYSMSPPPVQKKERGTLLTLVLAISTLANVIATFGVVLGGAFVDKAAQSADQLASGGASLHHSVSRIVLALAIFQVAQMASVGGLWMWKRWALLGYFGTSALAMLATIKMSGELPYFSMIWIGVVLIAVFPRLGMFED